MGMVLAQVDALPFEGLLEQRDGAIELPGILLHQGF
jgi:hypothetical protein